MGYSFSAALILQRLERVHVHPRPLKRGALADILEQAGISLQEFRELPIPQEGIEKTGPITTVAVEVA